MEMGCFVGTRVYDRPTFVLNDVAERQRQQAELQTSLEAAKRVNGKWITTLSSLANPRVPFALQTANMIDNLKYLGDLAARNGVVLLIEAINAIDYPNTFVTHVPHAYEIVKSVGSPGVKLMFDTFHAQIMDGDLIRLMDRTWDEIAFRLPTTPAARNLAPGKSTTPTCSNTCKQRATQAWWSLNTLIPSLAKPESRPCSIRGSG